MVQARGITGYRSLMRELGLDPIPFLKRFEIDPTAIDHEDELIPLDAVCALLEASSQAAACPNFGLRMSLKQSIDILGPLGLIMQNAATPFEAIELAGQYLFTHSPALKLDVCQQSLLVDDAIECAIEMDLPNVPHQRQTIDLCLGTSLQISRVIKPDGTRLKAVTLPHSPVAPLSVYQKFFGAAVLANEPVAALHFAAEGWNAPMTGSNQTLKQVTQDYLSRNFPSPHSPMKDRVRMVLRPLLGTPRAGRDDVAQILAIHPRSLHRHLAQEATSFFEIKDGLRRELAQKYLSESEMPLTQLAALLGFPEQSALSRACRKWFNASPSQLRKR